MGLGKMGGHQASSSGSRGVGLPYIRVSLDTSSFQASVQASGGLSGFWATSQLVTQSSRHTVKSSRSHLVTNQHCTKLRVGAQNSVSMQILRVTTNVQNFGAPRPLRGDSRGKCFFDPSSLKILVKSLIFFHISLTTIWPTNGENIGKSLIAYFLAGGFLKQCSTANLINFQ